MATTKQKFDLAVEIVSSLPKEGPIQPSDESRLKFYGYFKQATIGKCNASQPWAVDFVNRAKWNAWNGLGDMTSEEAMKNYADEFYKSLPSDFDEADPDLKAKLGRFRAMVRHEN